MKEQIFLGLITIVFGGILTFGGNFFTDAVNNKIQNPEAKLRQHIIDSLQNVQIKDLTQDVTKNNDDHKTIKNSLDKQNDINNEVIFRLKLIFKEVKGLSKYNDLTNDSKLQRSFNQKDTIQ